MEMLEIAREAEAMRKAERSVEQAHLQDELAEKHATISD